MVAALECLQDGFQMLLPNQSRSQCLKCYFFNDVLKSCSLVRSSQTAVVSSALVASVSDHVTFTFTEALTEKAHMQSPLL